MLRGPRFESHHRASDGSGRGRVVQYPVMVAGEAEADLADRDPAGSGRPVLVPDGELDPGMGPPDAALGVGRVVARRGADPDAGLGAGVANHHRDSQAFPDLPDQRGLGRPSTHDDCLYAREVERSSSRWCSIRVTCVGTPAITGIRWRSTSSSALRGRPVVEQVGRGAAHQVALRAWWWGPGGSATCRTWRVVPGTAGHPGAGSVDLGDEVELALSEHRTPGYPGRARGEHDGKRRSGRGGSSGQWGPGLRAPPHVVDRCRGELRLRDRRPPPAQSRTSAGSHHAVDRPVQRPSRRVPAGG